MRFDAWDFSAVQNTYSMLKKLEKHDVETIEDALFFLKKYMVDVINEERAERARIMRGTRYKVPVQRCEQCGGPIFLEEVNRSRCTRTGDNSKTLMACMDEKGCGWLEYSQKPARAFATTYVVASTDRQGRIVFVDEDEVN